MAVTKETDTLNISNLDDEHILNDTLNYRQHSIPDLIKRLDKLQSKISTNECTDAWIEGFIRTVIKCYLQCTEAIKLARSLFKLLDIWKSTHHRLIEKEFEDYLTSVINGEKNRKTELVTVSNLLESNEYIKEIVERHDVTVLTWLNRRVNSIACYNPLSSEHIGQLSMYNRISLQIYQFCPSTFASPVFDQTNQEKGRLARSLFGHLIQILRIEKYSIDCKLLCGTAVSLVLLKLDNEDEIANIFWRIYNILGTDKDFSIDYLCNPGKQLTPFEIDKPTIGHISVVKGILSCGSPLLQNEAFLQKCFTEITSYCKGPISLHYHAFCTMEQFYNKLLTQISTVKDFDVSEILSTTINIIWLNWDSPVQDVPQLCVKIFSLVLQIWHYLNKHSCCPDIVQDVLSRLRNVSWYIRGQYRFLGVLLDYTKITDEGCFIFCCNKILEMDIRRRLLQCMSTNYLAPNAADVYKSFLIKMRKERCFVDLWKNQWKETVIKGLTSTNRLQRSNVGHYWIQSTLKFLPEVKDSLMNDLTDMMASGTQPRDQLLYAWVTVMRVIRLNTGEYPSNTELLSEALYSNDDDIRIEGFSVICTSLKKADRLGEVECQILKEVLPYNLNIDSAPFRQQLSANVKNLLVRVRDSYRAISKDKDTPTIERSLDFVDWFYEMCVNNLFCGACYQRKKMCLDFLHITLDTFFPTKSSIPQISIDARKRGLWNFHSYESIMTLLHCVLDGADEVQNVTSKLLLEYCPWPLTTASSNKSPVDIASNLLSSAIELCDQPKQHENRSGVILLHIIFTKYMVDLKWGFSWKSDYSVTVDRGDKSSHLTFLSSLLNHIELSFLKSQENPVEASISSPIHGFVSALSVCIKELSHRQTDCNIRDILLQFIDLNCKISMSMMSVMSTESTEESSPSFAELGQAMESLIILSDINYSETTTLSSQYQFLLSWCWINIKECCHSLSSLCEVLLKQKDFANKISTVEKVKDIFIQVLTKCRHRGVTEGCRSSFVQFIAHLFSSSDSHINSIPGQILDKVFDGFHSNKATSITRRSAGIPIIIQAIVTVERKYKQTCLLQSSIEKLFKLSKDPLCNHYNDQHDLPQVHGLNILNTLFGDSSLSAVLMPYTSQAMVIVVTSFESPAWSIRNAATMLFSSLVMRIFGQKKNCSEEEWRGLTLLEFSTLYPELLPLMHQTLTMALEEDVNKIDRIKMSLFPVLTLLSNLGPVDGLYEKEHVELGHKVYKFLSSPVLYLRNLASSAFIALIPLSSLIEHIQSLSHPLKEDNCNLLHGILCCLDNITRHDFGKRSLSVIRDELLRNNHLLCSPCEIIRAKYLNLMKKLCWDSSQNMHQLTKLLASNSPNAAEIKIGESFAEEEVIQILQRSCILNGDNVYGLIQEHTNLSNIQSSITCINCLKNNIQQINKADLEHIQTYLSQLLAENTIRYLPLLSGILHVIIDIHYLIRSREEVVSSLYIYWRREATHSKNNIKSLNMVIGAICIEHMLKQYSTMIDEINHWSEEVYHSSQLIGAEYFKVAAGSCLKIAGQQIITLATDKEQLHPPAFLLIKAALSLIKDEDCDIRNIIVQFIVSLTGSTMSLSYPSVQFNKGCLMLHDILVCTFWNSHHVMKGLFEMLYTPREIQRTYSQRVKQKRQNLFEKEDNNCFSERIISCCDVYRTLMCILQKNIEQRTSLVELEGEVLVTDFEFFYSEMLNGLNEGNEMINRLTDDIVIGVLCGLLLATKFLCVVKTQSHVDHHWNSISMKLEDALKKEVLPPSFKGMMCTVMAGSLH